MKAYMLREQMYEGYWADQFVFNAKDERDAQSKAWGWGRYHSFIQDDIKVRPATEQEAATRMHNEYIF